MEHAVAADPVEVSTSQKLSASVQYFVGVYTALTLFRAPETWSPTSNNERNRLQQGLVQALDFLGSLPDVLACEIEYGHNVVKQMRQEARRPRPTVTYGDCDRPAAPTQVEARNSGSDHEMEGSAQEGSAQEGPCSAQQPLENADSAFEEMVASVDVSVQQPQEMVPARLEKAGSAREMEADVVAAANVDSAQ